jgi:putative ubiquitin-RnfH superfamily antitoxin RatB of RatAB toxin-antitoxin module
MIAVPFNEGMTAQQAIDASGLAEQVKLPELLNLGVFGSKIEVDTVLQVGDRVEIYRPLTINPKDIRRKRAAKQYLPQSCYQIHQDLKALEVLPVLLNHLHQSLVVQSFLH